jgi:hypothetical protein
MKISRVLGTDDFYVYIDKYHIRLDDLHYELIGRYVRNFAYPCNISSQVLTVFG